MADDKEGRDEQADDQKRRQLERMQEEAQTRADEKEPTREDPSEQLVDLDEVLETQEYPLTTQEVLDASGGAEIQTQGGSKPIDDVLSGTDHRTFDSAEDVRRRLLKLIDR